MTTPIYDDVYDTVREDVMQELLACYGEGENTDLPYLEDLADLVVSLVKKHARTVVDGEGY